MDRTFFKRMISVEEFNEWINAKEIRIDYLSKLLDEKIILNYTLESISELCNWLLDTYETLNVAYQEEDIYILDCCSTYVGETFLNLFGGDWQLQIDKEHYAFGFPSIANYRTKRTHSIPEYPHSWVTTTIHRRSCIIQDLFNRFGSRE
jgi:hypothetical protein